MYVCMYVYVCTFVCMYVCIQGMLLSNVTLVESGSRRFLQLEEVERVTLV